MGDLARFLRIREKAVRARVARGLLPAPFKLARNLAWTRAAVLRWLGECDRSARADATRITLRPYVHDRSRFRVDLRVMHPCPPHHVVRRRFVAPAGLDEQEACAWGERKLPEVLRLLAAGRGPIVAEEVERGDLAVRPRARSLTLAEFYRARFEPEYVRLQKRGLRSRRYVRSSRPTSISRRG